jgi:hypothetical protein
MTSIVCKKCGGYIGHDKPMTAQTLGERIWSAICDESNWIEDEYTKEDIINKPIMLEAILSAVMEALPEVGEHKATCGKLPEGQRWTGAAQCTCGIIQVENYKDEIISVLKGER